MTDWAALEEAAAALRRLNRAVNGRMASADDLRAVGAAAHSLAERLERAPVRVKAEDQAEVWPLAVVTESSAELVGLGERFEFDPFSLGGGRLHPASVRFDLHRDSPTSVAAVVVVDPMFQGPPERVHGGVVALIVDEVMGAVNRVSGRRAFTVRLTVNLRAAAPIGEPLELRAWTESVEGRKVTIRAEGRSAAGLFAEADGLFVMLADQPAQSG